LSQARIFGTDGIRGRAGDGWLAPDAVATLGSAIGRVLGAKAGSKRALLAHDGRRSGPDIETSLARGLGSAGFEIESAGLITTPGLAWLTRTRDYQIGVMVSASHNPAEDNGIKVFSESGTKLSDELELEIESILHQGIIELEATPGPKLDSELELHYLRHLVEDAAGDLKLDGMQLVLDCANGGGSRVAPRVFGRLGAQVHSIASEPDGDNINRECGSTHPENLQRDVRTRKAQIGIALDGDGDRCLLIDENGDIVHGDGIMTVLARYAMEHGELGDPRIVATVMSNRGLHRALREVGVEVIEVGVGDRQVSEMLHKENLILGGEQSGHIILGGEGAHIGDGIFTALRVLRVMRLTGKPLSQLAAPYQALPQVLLNVPVTEKPNLAELPEVLAAVREVERKLGEDGRVLLRYSGTEPLARVMVEGPDPQSIQSWAQELAEIIRGAIGS